MISGTVDVPVRFVLKTHVAEIEELKSEGCSYKKIHAVMVERKMLKCSYGSFVSAVHRLKQDVRPKKGEPRPPRPKKEEPKNRIEWEAEQEAEKEAEYQEIYGHD